jgi:hypothetical protein
LWLLEGLTSYYDRLCVLRSGQMPVATFLRRLGDDLGRLANVPGRHVQSIADASFDAWIKLYRPQDDSPNASVSYYLKGSLVGLLIDLWLRQPGPRAPASTPCSPPSGTPPRPAAAAGARPKKSICSPGFELEEFIQALTTAAGAPHRPIGCAPPGSNPASSTGTSSPASASTCPKSQPTPDALELGFTIQDRGGAPWVQFVYTGSPAEAAGLAAGDELLAARASGGEWLRLRSSRLRQVWDYLTPGEPAELLVARRERILPSPSASPPPAACPSSSASRIPARPVQQVFQRWTSRAWKDS